MHRVITMHVRPRHTNIMESCAINNEYRVEGVYLTLYFAVVQLLQYISDSGGILGLWFGFAIMTFIEFFEFFVDVIVLTCSKVATACGK